MHILHLIKNKCLKYLQAMKTKKTKIFLGGYVNYTNAQNLNCRALAKYLDKDKFECAVMILSNGNLSVDSDLDGVKLFNCWRPLRYWHYVTFFRGIMWCDVAYLPKGEIWKFCAKCLKWLSKKSFNTVEGVIDGATYEGVLRIARSDHGIKDMYNYTTKTYSITKYMEGENKRLLNIESDGIIYLGVETDKFVAQPRKRVGMNNVVFIGNDMRRKGVDDIMKLAKRLPSITFNLVGAGNGYDAVAEIHHLNLKNVVYHGTLNHVQMAKLLNEMDLHIFPSRSEGFPKVTLATAAMGVPSIVYSDYGAAEWITTSKNGFVVNTIDEVETVIKYLQQHPEMLDTLAEEAIKLAKSFDWKVLVKNWEKVIEDVAK